jgi:hypothetical protein
MDLQKYIGMDVQQASTKNHYVDRRLKVGLLRNAMLQGSVRLSSAKRTGGKLGVPWVKE